MLTCCSYLSSQEDRGREWQTDQSSKGTVERRRELCYDLLITAAGLRVPNARTTLSFTLTAQLVHRLVGGSSHYPEWDTALR